MSHVTAAEFQAAFDQHKDAVHRFAWRMRGSAATAEDITQDTFVALLKYPDRFDPARGALRAFPLGIARNIAFKQWRAEHRFEPLDDETVAAEPDDLEVRGDVGEMVGRAVRALGPLQPEVVILVDYEGFDVRRSRASRRRRRRDRQVAAVPRESCRCPQRSPCWCWPQSGSPRRGRDRCRRPNHPRHGRPASSRGIR